MREFSRCEQKCNCYRSTAHSVAYRVPPPSLYTACLPVIWEAFRVRFQRRVFFWRERLDATPAIDVQFWDYRRLRLGTFFGRPLDV